MNDWMRWGLFGRRLRTHVVLIGDGALWCWWFFERVWIFEQACASVFVSVIEVNFSEYMNTSPS